MSEQPINEQPILGYESRAFWSSHNAPRRSRISCASLFTSQHAAWSADYAFTESDLRQMVQRMLDYAARNEDASLKTCWQVEEDYAHIVAPIAHLRASDGLYKTK